MPKWKRLRWINILELVVLLDNVFQGGLDDEIGFEDVKETLRSFTMRLDIETKIQQDDLETALWSCNLLNEKGKFRHPHGIDFDEFLKKILRGDKFNRDYNYIEGNKGNAESF